MARPRTRFRFRLFDRWWLLKHVAKVMKTTRHKCPNCKHSYVTKEEIDGDCDDSHWPTKGKSIRVNKATAGRDRLETYIHESLHAGAPWMREYWVTEMARAQADLLYDKLGYRRPEDD